MMKAKKEKKKVAKKAKAKRPALAEAMKKVEELEKRVAGLEARPMWQYMPYPRCPYQPWITWGSNNTWTITGCVAVNCNMEISSGGD